MTFAPRSICLMACLLALAACQGDKKTAQQGTAQGEILPGSTSDAMLPYDTVRSQPPLAPLPTGGAKAGTKSKDAEEGEAVAEGSEAASAEDTGPGPAPVAAEAPATAAQ